MPEELWMEICDIVQEAVIKTIPKEKKMQKGKIVVWGSLTNSCEKKRSKRQRRKGKIYPFELPRWIHTQVLEINNLVYNFSHITNSNWSSSSSNGVLTSRQHSYISVWWWTSRNINREEVWRKNRTFLTSLCGHPERAFWLLWARQGLGCTPHCTEVAAIVLGFVAHSATCFPVSPY